MKRSQSTYQSADGSGGGVLKRPTLVRGSKLEIQKEEEEVARMLCDLTTSEDGSPPGVLVDPQPEDYREIFGECGKGAGRVNQIVATIHCQSTVNIETGASEPHEIDFANIYSQATHEDGSKLFKYFKVWRENGKEGLTPHWHLWGQLTRKVQLGARKKDHIANQFTLHASPLLKGGSTQYGCKHPWIDAAKASRDAMGDYCSKEGPPVSLELGVFDEAHSKQGKNANDAIFEMIDDGCSYLEIFRRFPDQGARMMKSIDRAIEQRDRRLVRTERTKGIIYYGETATGKSKRAYGLDWDPDKHYSKVYSTADKGSWRWWCGFTPQHELVVIDEARSGIPFREMLAMADNTPHSVEVKYGGKVNFRPKLVIATMPMHPREVWEHSLGSQEGWDQFTRRWRIIRCFKDIDENGDPLYLQQEDGGEVECYQNPHDLQFDCECSE